MPSRVWSRWATHADCREVSRTRVTVFAELGGYDVELDVSSIGYGTELVGCRYSTVLSVLYCTVLLIVQRRYCAARHDVRGTLRSSNRQMWLLILLNTFLTENSTSGNNYVLHPVLAAAQV